jgi:molybdenum cofactor cytidylyltransferase
MGEQKLLLPLGGKRLVEWATDAALGARVTETIVVLGCEAEAVREALGDRPVRIVINPAYAQGMSASLQAGVRAAGPDCDAAVFLLGDQPFVPSALVDRLIETFAGTDALIVRPAIGDRVVHPVLMSAVLFPEILEQRGDVGGREISERHRRRQVTVPWGADRPPLDIDTGDDYQAALAFLGARAATPPDCAEAGSDGPRPKSSRV